MMRRLLLLQSMVVIVLPCFLMTHARAADEFVLDARISPKQTERLYGSLLGIEVKIKNVSDDTQTFQWHDILFSVILTDTNGRKFQFKDAPKETRDEPLMNYITLKSKESFRFKRSIFATYKQKPGRLEFFVPRPGKYKIHCAYFPNEYPKLNKDLQVEYIQPKGKDLEVWKEVSSDTDIMRAIFSGQGKADVGEKVARLIKKYPKTAYIKQLTDIKFEWSKAEIKKRKEAVKRVVLAFSDAIMEKDLQALSRMISKKSALREEYIADYKEEFQELGTKKATLKITGMEIFLNENDTASVVTIQTASIDGKEIYKGGKARYKLKYDGKQWLILDTD